MKTTAQKINKELTTKNTYWANLKSNITNLTALVIELEAKFEASKSSNDMVELLDAERLLMANESFVPSHLEL